VEGAVGGAYERGYNRIILYHVVVWLLREGGRMLHTLMQRVYAVVNHLRQDLQTAIRKLPIETVARLDARTRRRLQEQLRALAAKKKR
jgi:hypothetical protein